MRLFQMLLILVLLSLGFTLHAETLATAYSVGSTSYATKENGGYGVVYQIVNSAPAAGAFVASSDDTLTDAAHGFLTGLKGQASTTTTLPAGLSLTTDYFVIYVSSGVYKLATTLANAIAGTAIDITDAGTGTHTFTPTALAGASIKLQCGSKDGLAFADIPITGTADVTKSVAVTATANAYLYASDLACDYVRSYVTLTAGQLSITLDPRVKGKVVAP